MQPPLPPATPASGALASASDASTAQVPALRREAQAWSLVSLISIFMGCTLGFGLIGTLLCYMASVAIDQGNFDDAKAKLKWGKIVTVSGAVIGIPFGITVIVINVLKWF